MRSRFILFRPDGDATGAPAPSHVPVGSNGDGSLVVTPQTGAPVKPMGVAAASEAARQAIAARGTALPPDAGAPSAPAPAPGEQRQVPEPGQPRASDGTFGRPLPADPNAPAAPADPNAAPTDGQAAPTDDEPADDAAARVVPIELPDGNALDLDVGDPVVADVIRGHIETAREAEAIRTESERVIDEVAQIRESIAIDPVGFALRELAESPRGQEHLALSLVTQPELFERLKPTLEAMLADPAKLELARAQQQAARVQFAEQARHEVAEQRAVRENLRDVQQTCAAIARLIVGPDGVADEARQTTAYNDMLRDLMAYAEKANVLTIEPDYIPAILARRLEALGLNPVEAAQRATEARGRRAPARPPRRTVSATPRVAPGQTGAPLPPAPRRAPNGEQFVESTNRRSAVAIPSAGAGSPNVGPDIVPPTKADGSKMNVAETVAWHREQIAKGKRGQVPLTR